MLLTDICMENIPLAELNAKDTLKSLKLLYEDGDPFMFKDREVTLGVANVVSADPNCKI